MHYRGFLGVETITRIKHVLLFQALRNYLIYYLITN